MAFEKLETEKLHTLRRVLVFLRDHPFIAIKLEIISSEQPGIREMIEDIEYELKCRHEELEEIIWP